VTKHDTNVKAAAAKAAEKAEADRVAAAKEAKIKAETEAKIAAEKAEADRVAAEKEAKIEAETEAKAAAKAEADRVAAAKANTEKTVIENPADSGVVEKP
jgi:membrane protein involved in colicin uptake